MKIQVNWHNPQIVMIRNLLFEHECDYLTNTLAPKLHNWDFQNPPEGKAFKTWTDVRIMKK